MGVKKDYLNSVVETVKRIDPSLNEDDIRKVASRIIKENIKDPSIITDNNVTYTGERTTLSKLCEWIDATKPVVSGNATFYCQPEELESPTSNMLRSLKKERKAVKKEMFKYEEGSDEYAMLDLDQQNKKVIMNAEYGGSGTPTAAFYTKYSPAATTLMAQSIITTMAGFFESFVGDNQKFFNINECYDWMNRVLETKKDIKIPEWVVRPTEKDVIRRIITHFYMFNINDHQYLSDYISNCNENELTYLYYANNMKTFIRNHTEVYSLVSEILDTLPTYEAATDSVPDVFKDKFGNANEYNRWISKEMFLDPYNIPECIQKLIKKMRELLKQFVFVEYITPDSIEKLNNHLRNTVLLVDTDSNIINSDIFVAFILNEVFPNQKFGRRKIYNEMILVNVLASMLDGCVANMLDYFGRCHNMGKDARAELTMKNEFMFRRLFLMTKKKRYAASIVLREGNIMIPFKLEIKGMDFIKAGVSDQVSKRFTKMLEEHVLYPDDLELHELMKDLKTFENEIYHNLRKGGTEYLKLQMYKAEGAYKKDKAWSLPVFRGSAVWNELYPDKRIYSLDRVKILKLTVTSINDLDKIKNKYPNEYKMVIDKIYNSTNPAIIKSGLKVIAIPSSVKKIPEWLLDLIDYDVIISDVISSFRSVLDALKIEEMYFKTPNGNANITSCLISL